MENAKSFDSAPGLKTKSISHALSSLNEAAHESSGEIRDVSRDSVAYLKTAVKNQATDAAKAVHARARENPWIFVGAAAALMGVMGFLFGRNFYKKSQS